MKHTPTPLFFISKLDSSSFAIVCRQCRELGNTDHRLSIEDYAAFIVKACNAHDELVEACQLAIETWGGQPYDEDSPLGVLEKAITNAEKH